MSLKSILLRIYNFGYLSKESTDENQRRIREVEWSAIKPYIPEGSRFLDVGCGAGYSMRRAMEDKKCECYGIDPMPGTHGVGRYSEINGKLDIRKGVSEAIAFPDASFDIVYSSHVLEHVDDEMKSLQEMNRVLRDSGIVILGMPTATMAWINCLTQVLFTTHQRMFNVLFGWVPFINTGKTPIINLLLPSSHSENRAKTVLYDLSHYKVNNWKKIVSRVFCIEKVLLPAIYPYPEYRQLFQMKTNRKQSSSVFFICKKKLC